MTKYYFIVKATVDENVGEIEASNEAEALEKIKDIYMPINPINGERHSGIELEIITKTSYASEKKRIEKERYDQANRTSVNSDASSESVEA